MALWRCRADRPLCDEEATFHGGRGRECSARSYARWARRGALAHRSNHLEHLAPPIPEGKGCRNGGWAYVVDLPNCAFLSPHTSRYMLELLHSATSLPCSCARASMFAARPTTSPDLLTRLEEPRCRTTLSRTDFPAPVCVARAVVLHRTPHWCPTPSADRIASHPFSRSLAPRVRCKTLLLPDVLRRWSSDHFLTLCDGSPELMGASGGGPDPPMAPGCSPASEMSPSPSPSPPLPPQPSLPSRTPPLPRAPPCLSLPSSSLHPPGQPLRRIRILPHAKARAATASLKPIREAVEGRR